MMRFSKIAAMCVVAVASVALAADEIEPGLKVGESAPAFNVRDITGPEKGNTLCYAAASTAHSRPSRFSPAK